LYFPMFHLGAVLALRRWTLSHRARTAALMLGLAALLQRHLTGSDDPFTRYLTAPGAALVIVSLTSGAAGRFLQAPQLQWLGRVSYSLYATHFPLLLALSVLGVHAGLAPSACALLAVPVCLLVAAVTQRLLEQKVQEVLFRL